MRLLKLMSQEDTSEDEQFYPKGKFRIERAVTVFPKNILRKQSIGNEHRLKDMAEHLQNSYLSHVLNPTETSNQLSKFNLDKIDEVDRSEKIKVKISNHVNRSISER